MSASIDQAGDIVISREDAWVIRVSAITGIYFWTSRGSRLDADPAMATIFRCFESAEQQMIAERGLVGEEAAIGRWIFEVVPLHGALLEKSKR